MFWVLHIIGTGQCYNPDDETYTFPPSEEDLVNCDECAITFALTKSGAFKKFNKLYFGIKPNDASRISHPFAALCKVLALIGY